MPPKRKAAAAKAGGKKKGEAAGPATVEKSGGQKSHSLDKMCHPSNTGEQEISLKLTTTHTDKSASPRAVDSPTDPTSASNTMNHVPSELPAGNEDHTYSIHTGAIQPNGPSPDYMRRFDEIICDFLRELGVPGAAFSLSLHGQPVYRQGYGMGGGGVPVTASSHFRVGSISKVLTAIGVMKLCEKGELYTQQLVFGKKGILKPGRFDVHEQFATLTVQHLLRHCGGWDRDIAEDHVYWYLAPEHQGKIDPWDNMSLLRYVMPLPPQFTPGERHAYSNFGYLLLGNVLESVTGVPYEDYIRSLLAELDIHDAAVGHSKHQYVDYREVEYYNNSDPAMVTSIFPGEGTVPPQYGSFPMENSGPFGGWVTSATNLVTILDSLAVNAKSHSTMKNMLIKPRYAKGDAWYGYGLDVNDNGASFGHTGAMEGTAATVYHHESGLTWSLLLNAWAMDLNLNGLVKYALSSVPRLPLWHGDLTDGWNQNLLMSADKLQCVRIQLPHSQLAAHAAIMKEQGYVVSHINALTQPHEVLFDVVWDKNSSNQDWIICTDIRLEHFYEIIDSYRENLFHVSSLESYVVNDALCHLLVAEQRGQGEYALQLAYCVDNMPRHREMGQFYLSNGYCMQLQSIMEYGDRTMISAVYEQQLQSIHKPAIKSQKIWMSVPVENFVGLLKRFSDKLLSIDYLQFYSSKDDPKVSCIWSKRTTNWVCFQIHDVSRYGFLLELMESMRTNLPVKSVSSYVHEGVTYFAAIWDSKLRPDCHSSASESNKPSEPVTVQPLASVGCNRRVRSKECPKSVRNVMADMYGKYSVNLLPPYERYRLLFQNVKSALMCRQLRDISSSSQIEVDIAESLFDIDENSKSSNTSEDVAFRFNEIRLAGSETINTIAGCETVMPLAASQHSGWHRIQNEVNDTTTSNPPKSTEHVTLSTISGFGDFKMDVHDTIVTNYPAVLRFVPSTVSDVSNPDNDNMCNCCIKSENSLDDDQCVSRQSNSSIAKTDGTEDTEVVVKCEPGSDGTFPERILVCDNGEMEWIKVEINQDDQDEQEGSDPIPEVGHMDTAAVANTDCAGESREIKFSETPEFMLINNRIDNTNVLELPADKKQISPFDGAIRETIRASK